MRIKIGTQMDERIFHALKVAAAHEKRPVGELLQEAAAEYIARRRPRRGKNGLQRFLESPPVQVSDEAFREIMQADYYDQ
ncbi:MAG TPA: hypothetical protein VHV47_02575 [Opitutaceae bacterium]|jgi:hypothetical protein|nr:hypothetical protein [Opitutaceae bacterium]